MTHLLLRSLIIMFSAVCIVALSSPIVDVSALHFAVFSIPFYGHFLPVKSIAEQLVLNDHYVTVFAENLAWCESIARRPSSNETSNNTPSDPRNGLRCVAVPMSKTFPHSLFEEICTKADPIDSAGFTRIFEELQRHQAHQLKPIFEIAKLEFQKSPFDAILYDMATFVGADIAAALGGLPKIAVFPLVLTLANTGVTPAAPVHGSGFSRELTLPQRSLCSIQGWLTPMLGQILIARLHKTRREAGIVDKIYHDVHDFSGTYDPVVAPTIWGHDVSMPMCPNVKPVGILEALPHPGAELEPELVDLFTKSECKDMQRIYINFGTLSVMSDAMFKNLTGAVKLLLEDTETPSCVIWKLRAEAELAHIKKEREAGGLLSQIASTRLVVRKRFNDPQKILPHVHVFVSHCGDTSVGEAVNKLTPVAGIPFFADQVDVCNRMQERGFGVHIGDKFTFTPQTVVDAVKSIGINSPRRPSVEKALKETRDVARWLGGAKEAARWIGDIVEKNITRAFHCRHMNPNALKHEMEGTWSSEFQHKDAQIPDDSTWKVITLILGVLAVSDFDIHAISGLIAMYLGYRLVKRILFS